MKLRQRRKFKITAIPVMAKRWYEYQMDRWDHSKDQREQKFIGPVTITVETEAEREQILLALRYLHDQDIDTDYMAVNCLVHIYMNPESVVVNEKETSKTV
jgi:hypothetical protein